MNKKKILFLLGDMPKYINDGHSLNAFIVISSMVENYDCYVLGNYSEDSFLHGIHQLKGKIYNLEKNRNTIIKIKSIILFKPIISMELYTNDNLKFINKIIQEKNIDILHGIFFPSICNLSKKINIKKKIITMPDLYSKYYFQLLKKYKKLKYLFNFLSYKLLEFQLRNNFQSVQFVNYHETLESGFKNANCIPLLLPEKGNIDNNKRKLKHILLSRSNMDNTLWFMKNIINKLKNYNFIILSNDKEVVEYYELNKTEYQNVKLIKWIDNYDDFIRLIYLHVIIDFTGTGQSNKVIQAFNNGNLVIGTKLTYRGLLNLPEQINTYFTTESDLISNISELMILPEDLYLERKELAKKYIERHFDNKETLNMMKKIYKQVLANET